MTAPALQTLVTLPESAGLADATAVAEPLDLTPALRFLVTIRDARQQQIGCGAGATVDAAARNAVADVEARRIKSRWFDAPGIMTDTRERGR